MGGAEEGYCVVETSTEASGGLVLLEPPHWAVTTFSSAMILLNPAEKRCRLIGKNFAFLSVAFHVFVYAAFGGAGRFPK